MYSTIMQKLTEWNRQMNGIPRKCVLIALTILAAIVFVLLFPYCWPFLIALLFSLMLEPFVRVATGWLERIRLGRTAATLIGMLLLCGVVGAVVTVCLLYTSRCV